MAKYLGSAGLFCFYGSATAIGAIFYTYYLEETSGLSDKEKKSLYFPDEFKEVKHK